MNHSNDLSHVNSSNDLRFKVIISYTESVQQIIERCHLSANTVLLKLNQFLSHFLTLSLKASSHIFLIFAGSAFEFVVRLTLFFFILITYS